MRLPARGWRQPARITACAAVMMLAVVTLGSSVALGSFTTATVTNSANTIAAGSLGGLSLREDATGATCTANSGSETECPWSPLPLSPIPGGSAGGLIAKNLTLTNLSPATGASGYLQQIQMLSCAPRSFTASGAEASNALLTRWGIERQLTDRWGGTNAARFDGVNSYATGITGVAQNAQLATDFSVGVMFRAEPGSAGGGMMSLAHLPAIGDVPLFEGGAKATMSLRLNFAGIVQFKVSSSNGFDVQANGPRDLRDGQWHSVVANFKTSPTGPSAELFIDGVLAGQNAIQSQMSGQTALWYWQVGITPLGGISEGTSKPYFLGDLSGAFVASTSQTPASAAAISAATSPAQYSSAIANARHVWMLGDDKRTAHTGTAVFGGTHDACTSAAVRWRRGDFFTIVGGQGFRRAVNEGAQPAAGAPAPIGGNSIRVLAEISRISQSGWFNQMTGVELLAPVRYSLFVGTNWRASILFRDVVIEI